MEASKTLPISISELRCALMHGDEEDAGDDGDGDWEDEEDDGDEEDYDGIITIIIITTTVAVSVIIIPIAIIIIIIIVLFTLQAPDHRAQFDSHRPAPFRRSSGYNKLATQA